MKNSRIFLLLIGMIGALFFKTNAQDTIPRYVQFMGQVNDDADQSIPGVILKNLSRSGITSSNNLGQFIMVVAPGDIIQFSFAGFKPQKIRIPSQIDNTRYVKQIVLTNDTIMLNPTVVHAYPGIKTVFMEPFPEVKLGEGVEMKMDHAPTIKAPNPVLNPLSAIANAVQKRKMKNCRGGLSPYNQSLMIKDFFKEGGSAVPDSLLRQYK